MVKDIIFDVILSHVYQLVKDKLHDDALPELVLKLLPFPILGEMPKYLLYICIYKILINETLHIYIIFSIYYRSIYYCIAGMIQMIQLSAF